jgi:hypothetical protein
MALTFTFSPVVSAPPLDAVAQIMPGPGWLGTAPPALVGLWIGYRVLRALLPLALIALATRDATPAQRISLVRAYLCPPIRAGTQTLRREASTLRSRAGRRGR